MVTRNEKSSIWHTGEVTLQKKAGVQEKMAKIGERHIRGFMLDQHREFFSQLPFLVIGTVDELGYPWVGIRAGKEGFIKSPNPQILQIKNTALSDDPMERGMKENAAIGLLGIELHTRRRNRMNGYIRSLDDNKISVEVDQSFGNCPRYINLRHVARDASKIGTNEKITKLDESALNLIKNADTFFVSSYVDREDGRQVDVSHRGGDKGFVHIELGGIITIPDYSGNNFFATLGNIILNQKAGITFIDFENGTLLQMTGRAELLEDNSSIEINNRIKRAWRFWPEEIIRRYRSIPLHFKSDG